jgi:putative membrane protein
MAHEAIASQIEEPFGTDDNDLALSTMSFIIEDALRDMRGEPAVTLPDPQAESYALT